VVEGRVENSILFPGVQIENEAVVKSSVLMSRVTVGNHSMIQKCIIDEQVNIGKYCFVGFGGGPPSECQNITVLGKGVVVPPHTAIGHNCSIISGSESNKSNVSVIPSHSRVVIPS